METNLVGHLLALVEEADRDHDGRINMDEWRIMGMTIWIRMVLPFQLTFPYSLTNQEESANGRETHRKSERIVPEVW